MKRYHGIKKYLCVMLIGILAITMIGCGSEKKEASTSGQVEKPKEIVAIDEIINAKQYNKTIQIGDKIINLPAKLSDFIDIGAVLTSNNLSLDYIMDSKSNKICDMTINETKFQLCLENNTDKSAALKDLNVRYIDNIQGKDIFFDGGINVGSKLDELTQKWGEPSFNASKGNDTDMIYCYYDYCIKGERLKAISSAISQDPISGTGNSYTVTIDRKTATIKNIQYKWPIIDDTSILKENSTEISFGGQKFKLSYKIPAFLQNDKPYVSIFMIDDVPYIIVADSALQGLGDKRDSISEQDIADKINIKYSDTKYDIEVISKTDNEVYADGYSKSENSLKCVTLYMNKEHYYETYKWEIAPYDSKGVLTDAAISKFKNIVSQFTQSIHEVKA